MLLNELEIINHTHTKKSLIALIIVFQVFAGKLFAFITELHLVVQKQLASFLEKRTLLVSWSATDAVRHSDSLALDIMFEGKVATAYPAVHATGSN